MSNSVDSDETDYYKPSHLVLRCLQKSVIIAFDSERVKRTFLLSFFLSGSVLQHTGIYILNTIVWANWTEIYMHHENIPI